MKCQHSLQTSMISLSGAFAGLNDFLEHFGPSEQDQAHFAKRLYKCIKPMARPIEGRSNKAMHRNALKLLTVRSELFSLQIFDDFLYWHDLLVNMWLKMTQNENRDAANDLLQAVHRVVAGYLCENAESDRDGCLRVLQLLLSEFKKTLQLPTSEVLEVRRAIVGLGLLGAPCKKLQPPAELDDLLNLVLQRTKCVANDVNAQQSRDQLQYFPEYVQALSNLMEHTSSLSGVQLNVLQEIIVSVIRNFHLLNKTQHAKTIETLMNTFTNLLKLGELSTIVRVKLIQRVDVVFIRSLWLRSICRQCRFG